MRVLATALLALSLLTPTLARAGDPVQAGQWPRLPQDARMAYMTGAAAGASAFSQAQPGAAKLARIRVDQAVTNMDHLSRDPMYARKPISSVALQALTHAQDTGVSFVEKGSEVRDPQFDQMILFDRPWLAPIDLDALVPRQVPGSGPTYARTWLDSAQHQKQFFVEGFGDMVYQQCLDKYGDTPAGQGCLKPLAPLPPDVVLAEMDAIYRDRQFERVPYDKVIRAALAKMAGGDWRALLAAK